VAETPAERRARIVNSEATNKRVVHRWTNHGARPPPKLAPYTAYATGASSSRGRPRSPTPPPSSSSSDEVDSRRVIDLEDFVNEPAEEECALMEALAKTAAEAAAQQKAEEAERLAALRAVEAFQEREAARAIEAF
jgi:hypothetical protein